MSGVGGWAKDRAKTRAKNWAKKAIAAKVSVVVVPVVVVVVFAVLVLSIVITKAQIAAEQETRDLRGVMADEAIAPEVLKIYAEVGAETNVPWHVLAALAETATHHGSQVPNDPTDRTLRPGGEAGVDAVTFAPVVSPPIDVELEGRRYVGPFLIDAETLAADPDGADVNPDDVAQAAEFLAEKLLEHLYADPLFAPDVTFVDEVQRALWEEAIAALPVFQSTFAPPPTPMVPQCPSATVFGDGLMSAAAGGVGFPTGDIQFASDVAGRSFAEVIAEVTGVVDPAPADVPDGSLMVVSAGAYGWGDLSVLGVSAGADAVFALLEVAPVGRLVVVTPPEADPQRPIGSVIAAAAETIPDLQVRVIDGSGWVTDPATQFVDPANGAGVLSAEGSEAFGDWVFTQLCDDASDTIVIPPAPFAQRVLTWAESYLTGVAAQCNVGSAASAGTMVSDRAVYESILATYAAGQTIEPRTATAEERQRMVTALAAASQAGFAGDRLVVIVSLAGRESRWQPDAYNGNRATGDNSYGLLQINTIQESVWTLMASELGFSRREDLFDPVNNMRAARWLYDRSASVPFFAWGPYRGDPPLHFGAEDWVQAVLEVATAEGFLDASGNAVVGGRTIISSGCAGGMLSVSPTIEGLLTWAQSMTGTPYAAINPYRFGTQLWPGGTLTSDFIDRTYTFPAGTRVFDCSGFVITAFRQIGIDLPSLGGSDSQSIGDIASMELIDRAQIMPGDIIVYSPLNGIGHVGISMGGDQMVDASPRGVGVKPVDWSRVSAIRRPNVSDAAAAAAT